jgi:hypothetical protein
MFYFLTIFQGQLAEALFLSAPTQGNPKKDFLKRHKPIPHNSLESNELQ